jgi:L-lactate dehydrogenase complex protein LldF
MKTPDVTAALGDKKLQLAIYTATGRMAERRREVIADDVLPDYQDLRQHAHDIKKHTLDHLDYYLEELERNVEARGGKVIWAKDGTEACAFIQKLAQERGVKTIVKSKSMTTEEIHLNDHLEAAGIEAIETDLGEYILQLNGERPFHIIAPAMHKTKEDVSDVFEKHLGTKRETSPEALTKIARVVLREKFLEAQMGISGANFLVADSGAIVVVENEGNARLSTSAPKIHVAVAGIEKLIPRAQDLGVFLKLLGRSATGQPLSVYTSFLAGAKREGEPDGPEEFYLVLLDNGRTKLLADESKRQSLYCIRCGACLNHCPVYRKIGGYNYPWVYSGPIGKILTPQFKGVQEDPWLPYASSLCGACGEVCPVKIEIPRILLELRAEKVENGGDQAELWAFKLWAWVMEHPKFYTRLASMASTFAPSTKDGWIESLPGFLAVGPLKNWLSERDLPVPPRKSFRDLWHERRGKGGQN